MRQHRVIDILMLCALGGVIVLIMQKLGYPSDLAKRSLASDGSAPESLVDVMSRTELSAEVHKVEAMMASRCQRSRDLDPSERELYRQSRVALSRELNRAKQELGQLSCKMQQLQHSDGVSVTGGWCLKSSKPGSKQHAFDSALCAALSSLLKGKRVASFGDGPGTYKKKMDELGQVNRYDAFDGAPFVEEVTSHNVHFLDLTAPQYGLELYDWVISLEVAEHIPAKFESIYLDNLFRHAKEGIILSWARPKQKGHFHVNPKSPDDVIAVMRSGGFQVDAKAGESLRKIATFPWFQRNLEVFRRNESKPAKLEDV